MRQIRITSSNRAQMLVFTQPANTEGRTEKGNKEEGITVVAPWIYHDIKKDPANSQLTFASCLGG